MTYEEMKTRKIQLEKDLAELNKEMNKHEKMIYEGKLNKAIALLEEYGRHYDMGITVGEVMCFDCMESIGIDFGDIINMLKKLVK